MGYRIIRYRFLYYFTTLIWLGTFFLSSCSVTLNDKREFTSAQKINGVTEKLANDNDEEDIASDQRINGEKKESITPQWEGGDVPSTKKPEKDIPKKNNRTKSEAGLKRDEWTPKSQKAAKKKRSNSSPKKKKKKAAVDGLPVFGFVESVRIGSKKLRMKAKLDSGASTSSLYAVDITEFERDGKKWVRFHMIDPKSDKKVKFERKVKRISRIKEHQGKSQRRPVVLMDVALADIHIRREFTLADRENFIYPILLGRNFLNGVGLVDASRTFLTKKQSSRNK